MTTLNTKYDQEDTKGGTCSKCGAWKGGSYGIDGEGNQTFHKCTKTTDTLNTIIEEEIVRIRTDLKMYELPYLEAFLTTAMQRAYGAGQEEKQPERKCLAHQLAEAGAFISEDLCNCPPQPDDWEEKHARPSNYHSNKK